MILFPPAKINLGLNIIEKRPDNYHEIESVLYPIPLFDILEVLPWEELNFRQSGIAIPGEEKDNLCLRAYDLMKEKYQIPPVYIHLIKNIPMGAGLGGGSADGAYILRALNSIYNLQCSALELEDLAARLGSDCPFFIHDEPMYVTGRGEKMKPVKIDLKGWYLKLINPGIHVSTSEAYSNVTLSGNRFLEALIDEPVNFWMKDLENVFEKTVFQSHPELYNIKHSLYNEGAVYAAMSGSGSTMFGLFLEEPSVTGKAGEWVLPL